MSSIRVMKKAVLLVTVAEAALDQAVNPAHVQPGHVAVKNAVGATLNPVFMLQGSDPNGKGSVPANSNWSWNAANWKQLQGKTTTQNDGRTDRFVEAICEANGGGRWQVATTDGGSPAERWAGKKTAWRDNTKWSKIYDKMMQKPGKDWQGVIFSTGSEFDNVNGGKGDGNLRKKDDDDGKTALNHPKNANSIDLATDLRNAMEDSLIWQYRNLHKKGANNPWQQKDFRRAQENSEKNAPLYESFYKLMSTWHNSWSTYQLIMNPSPKLGRVAAAPCRPQSYNPSEQEFKKQSAWRPFSADNMPDAELLEKFQTELNKRDGVMERVTGVFPGGFDAGRYVARATLDLSRGDKCLRKDVEAAELWLQNGQFDQGTMVSFWKSLQVMANYHDSDGSLEWLIDLAHQQKQNPTVGPPKVNKEVEQCPPAEEKPASEAGEGEKSLHWGYWLLIIVSILAAIGGVIALTLFLCVSSEPSTDDL